MADATDLLIRAYVGKIASLNTGYNVWAKYLPSTENGDCYIQVGTIAGNDEPGKRMRIERYTVVVGIYSQNPDVDVDFLAGTIRDAICDTNRKCLISIAPLKTSIIDESTSSPDPIQFPDAIFTNRYLTFTHLIH